jgi:nucleotide-binding universal stress UspA family protein
MSSTSRQVVVGVDGQTPSAVALDWAVDEASRHHLPMLLVHALAVPLRGPALDPVLDPPTPRADPESDRILGEAVARVHSLAPDVRVETATGYGRAANLLVDASAGAAMVVVGARGRGAVASMMLGSTSVDVAAHAHCPVAVIRQLPTAEPQRPGVVVGSDGSPVSEAAVAEAFRQADSRGLALTVVHTWQLDYAGMGLPVFESEQLRTQVAEEEQALAAEVVAGWSEKYPDVVVRQHVLQGHPVQALVQHSRGAELLVVGSRGRGGFRGLLLGSVSQGVLHHAGCPVLVVRPEGRS